MTLPWFKQSNWLMKNIVGNWTASPIYTYETPEFVTVQSSHRLQPERRLRR